MAKRIRALTTFGRDLDSLLEKAGISSIREYADACGVNYTYVLQLRTVSERRPGRLYVDLLKPFARLKILDINESHRLSLRHRGKHLSFTECHELFPELSDQEILESVKQASEIIDKTSISLREPEIEEQDSPDTGQFSSRRDLLYRNIFVGRQPELSALTETFDAAVAGQGSLVMIAGEPGIGKTAICEQLSTYIVSKGGKTLWGHCYEEGSLSLPYLAFIEAMRSHVLNRDADELMKELGSGASDVARIMLEIREKLNIEPRESQNPEEDRYRLFQAVSSFLTNAAAVKPMCIILEDLHDADKSTLEMLSYVSRNVNSTRLLLVGTYRDVEVDRSHPLSAALAELRRVSSFKRILLRGLTVDEVRRMLAGITREEIPVTIAETIHRQTEGNPLFTQEVIRYLIEENLLTYGEGRRPLAEDTTLEISIPEGLRDVIGKRLTLLTTECNHLLSVAAVIGREFSLDTLRLVTNMNEDTFINALKEAVQTAVLEERKQVGSVQYRFTHAFFRQTLYEEMIAPQRLQLHQQVARVIEGQYEKRLEEHASELAEHFSQSTDPIDLEKAVKYSEMAAKRAMDVYAYSESVRLYDQAIKVQKVLNPDGKEKMCDLLLDLCDALLDVPDVRRIQDSEAPAAFSLAESIGDTSRAVRACHSELAALSHELAGPAFTTPQWAEWTERADRYSKTGTVERARTDFALGCMKCASSDFENGQRFLIQAYELASHLNDETTASAAGSMLLLYRIAPQYTSERLQLAEELLTYPQLTPEARWWIGDTFLALGQRQRAKEAVEPINITAQRTGNLVPETVWATIDAAFSVMDGRLEEGKEKAESVRFRGMEAGMEGSTGIFSSTALVRALLYLGTSREAYLSELPDNILLNIHFGRKEVVEETLNQIIIRRTAENAQFEAPSWAVSMWLEASVLTGNTQAAEILMPPLSTSPLCTSGFWYPSCVQRHLGGAAALLERYVESRDYFKEAIKICMEMEFRPELALTRLQLAELLLDHYPNEKSEALEHLDFAIKEFREMKMQPSLERALRRKDILKA